MPSTKHPATMPRVANRLIPTAEGGWTARKRIPEDAQDAYEKLYGVRWEARFRCGPMTAVAARAKHREWLSEVEARISNIRAERTGEGSTLTAKQARALSGEWHTWFVEKHVAEPSSNAHWEGCLEGLLEEMDRGVWRHGDPDDLGDPEWDRGATFEANWDARADARAVAADWAETSQFLHKKRITLNAASRDLFLDFVCRDLYYALKLLIKRGTGDWSEDPRPSQFPKYDAKGDVKLTPGLLFQRWAAASQPARATLDRWRSVFLKLEEDFPVSASAITPEEAQDWCNGLVGPGRSAGTVNVVWIGSARRVFGWALRQKLIPRNPFKDVVKLTVPRKIRTREGKAFNSDEIKIILRAASSITDPNTKAQAARRWVPWLCAYTGARAGEITQLRGVDVLEQDGVHAIRITPEAGTVKTRQPLTVPLHEHLIEQGFLEFAKSGGSGPLFYNEDKREPKVTDPTNPPTPRSVTAREALGKWIRGLGITDPEVRPLHGWRHTFKQIGSRNNMREHILDAICGHSPAYIGRGYNTPTLGDKAEELKKFPRYGLD
jgi:integrase